MSSSESNIVEFHSPAGALLRQVAETAQERPWFVAKDVCDALGIAKPRNAVASLSADQKGALTVGTLGGPQKMTVVSESGLYALVFKSRKAEALEFQRWVTEEVLPSIRRTGSYSTQAAPAFDLRQLTRVVPVPPSRPRRRTTCRRSEQLTTGAAVRAAYVSSDGVRRRQGCVPGCTPFKS